jgi:cysteine desulfurase
VTTKSPASNGTPPALGTTQVYLDYNATTPVDPAVLDAMLPYFSDDFANASSIHSPGQRARSAVEIAREQVAALIGADPKEIVFTSGGTESDNHAVFGIVASPLDSFTSFTSSTSCASHPHIITTAIEHEAVLNACQALEKRGAAVTYLPVDKNGLVDPAAVRAAICPETALITIMHANNELGTVQPLREIGRIAAQADTYFHTDAVQSDGKIPVDVNALGVDLLALSGHKIYAPKGIGALYIRSGTRLQQLLYGGHHQRGARPGTENVAGIVGLGAACAIARKSLVENAARIAALRDRLEREILARVPDSHANASAAPRTPNTSNIIFPGIEGEALLISLDLQGLACSTGAACSSGAVEPSHVLTAIGLSPADARASLRFSLGRQTTEGEIDLALQIIPAAVARLRELSPAYARTSVGAGQRL